MKYLITKFLNTSNYANNYFIGSDHLSVIDYITISKQLLVPNGLPIFNDELTRPNEPLKFKANDFNPVISLLDKTKSNLGKSIQEFFTLDKNYIIRLMVEQNDSLNFIGFIDTSSIDFDYNTFEDSRTVTFTIYSGEKEWSDYNDTVLFGNFPYINHGSGGTHDPNDMNFGTFMQYIVSEMNAILDDRTNLDELVHSYLGWYPKTSPLQLIFQYQSYWRMFSDILKGYGIMFKMIPNPVYCKVDQWGKPNVVIFFRSDGFTLSNFKVIEHHEKIAVNLVYNLLVGLYTHYKNRESPILNGYDAYFLTKGAQYYTINFLEYADHYSGGGIDYAKDSVFNTDMSFSTWNYANFGQWGQDGIQWGERDMVTAPRFFVKSYTYTTPYGWFHKLYDDDIYPALNDFGSMLLHIFSTKKPYNYILYSPKKRKVLKIKYDYLFQIQSYSKFEFQGISYWIEKISNVDLFNRTAILEGVEI